MNDYEVREHQQKMLGKREKATKEEHAFMMWICALSFGFLTFSSPVLTKLASQKTLVNTILVCLTVTFFSGLLMRAFKIITLRLEEKDSEFMMGEAIFRDCDSEARGLMLRKMLRIGHIHPIFRKGQRVLLYLGTITFLLASIFLAIGLHNANNMPNPSSIPTLRPG
jgi:hypothetical protein